MLWKINLNLLLLERAVLFGRTVLAVLEEENLPISEYAFFASSRSAGKIISFMGNDYTIRELDEHSFDDGFDFAIFSAGADVSRKYAPIAASCGCTVIDNSSAFRMINNVPLIVPEVNINKAFENPGIIANPNCSTIQAVVALKPLDIKYKLRRIIFSTYQAVSGAGQNGIEDFKATMQGKPAKKFPYPIFNNCIPHIDKFEESGYTKEEMKMINETRKILDKPSLPVTVTAVRVPVTNCHCESINIEFKKDFDLEELIGILKSAPGIVVLDNPNENIYPLPTLVSGKNDVYVGRIRRDYSVKYGINLWIVADNIRKGAATNAVQILKALIEHEKCQFY